MFACSQKYDEMHRQYQAMNMESEQKIRDLEVVLVITFTIRVDFSRAYVIHDLHIPQAHSPSPQSPS